MRIAVAGLWHLGSVTAACMAAAGHTVSAYDSDVDVVRGLTTGRPPIFEPGLAELIRDNATTGRLTFTSDAQTALAGAEVLWITYDTPVDENDQADVAFVTERVRELAAIAPRGCLVIVSSQVPVGTTRALATEANSDAANRAMSFAVLPENLRLGSAIEVFSRPDRVIAGIERDSDRNIIQEMLRPITGNIVFMSLESAEMTKHAINSFLALSITFANEIATICEVVGADADEVATGLKTESRIGPKAYVSPGVAFSGGTLARDIAFLTSLARNSNVKLPVLGSVAGSNDNHRRWPLERLRTLLGDVSGKTIVLLGLTYKAGTDTLRRSYAIELAGLLNEAGARVKAYDPKIRSLPTDSSSDNIALELTPDAAISAADAIVVTTEWPEFRDLDWPTLLQRMTRQIVVDPKGFLAKQIARQSQVTYARVGHLLPGEQSE